MCCSVHVKQISHLKGRTQTEGTKGKVLRKISVPKMEERVRPVVHMGERTGAQRVLVGKPVGNRPLGRPLHRLEYFKI